MSIREISRRTGLARNAVKKHLRSEESERRTTPSKLDPYAEKLATWLVTEATKSRKRRTLRHIYTDSTQKGENEELIHIVSTFCSQKVWVNIRWKTRVRLQRNSTDIEPLLGMICDWDVLHGPSHTILGALLIAAVVAWLSPPLCNFILSRFNQEVVRHKLPFLQEPYPISRAAGITGAFFGTFSHLVLDSMMHHDIHPLAPFSNINPLSDLVSHDDIYKLCLVLGIVGVAAWAIGKRVADATRH